MYERFLNKALAFSFFFENNEIMPANIKSQDLRSETKENQLELESIDFFVRMMGILGMPRSVGEIYGLLYFSEDPLSMDQIVQKLGMSLGSASQGLKTLRSLKAVRTSYVAGERKDHYQAETEFRRLFSNFLKEEILPTWKVHQKGSNGWKPFCLGQSEDEFYKIRIEKLKKLTRAEEDYFSFAGLLKLWKYILKTSWMTGPSVVLYQGQAQNGISGNCHPLHLENVEVFFQELKEPRKVLPSP